MRLLFAPLLLLAACDPVRCDVPGDPATDTARNGLGCSGDVIASGAMSGALTGPNAEAACEGLLDQDVSCCAFTTRNGGEWVATNGWLVRDGGVPTSGSRSAGACSAGE